MCWFGFFVFFFLGVCVCVCVCFHQNTQEGFFFLLLPLLKSIEYGSDLDNSLPIDRLQERMSWCGNSICSVVAHEALEVPFSTPCWV